TSCSVNRRRAATNSPTFLPRGGIARNGWLLERKRHEDLMIPTLFVVLTFSLLYWFPVRRWMNRWGATPSDLTRVMAGDALLQNPTYSVEIGGVRHAQPREL